MKHDADQLIDTLSGVLRDFGRHAFDLERQEARRTQSLFDQWAQHLLTGIAAPGQKDVGKSHRYAELRAQFASHRKLEHTEFSHAQDALRDVVWSFVSSVNREVTAERAEDVQLQQSLGGLSTTLQTAPPNELRKLALEAVKQVQGVLSARRERQARQVADLAGQLESMGSQLEVARRESTIDGLTQLFNRKAFDEQLQRIVELAGLRREGAALLIIDIDHFKKVNDSWGHPAGDAVIRAVAAASSRVFKRKHDFVARYGGEELVVLLRDVSSDDARELAEKLRAVIEGMRVEHDKQTIQVTVSCGLADWGPGETASLWLARADQALYRAKNGGRNRVEG